MTMSVGSDSARSFAELTAELAAAGFRLDWMDEGPVRGEPMFAAFAHADGRRIRFSHDLLTGRSRLEEVAAPPQVEAAAFSGLAVETRRQVLRWWMVRRAPFTDKVEAVLIAALADADPETRVTAVLCALRLQAFGLVDAVARADIPQNTADGAFPGDRLLYGRLRKLAVEALSGRGGERASILFGLLAEPSQRPEALLLHALCTPLPEVEAPEAEPPEGVVVEGATLRLRGLGAELVWIPAIAHWRGGLRPADSDDPRPRLETPSVPFFVTKHALTPGELSHLGVSSADGLVGPEDLPDLLAGAARVAGQGTAIPNTGDWSMALHGPDGRPFPWGHALRPAQRCGPWGAYWSDHAEWTMASGAPELRSVQRRPPASRGAIRLMIA